MTEEAVVALGSNIPPRMALLREALFLMEKLPETRLADRSKVYETEPAGGPPQGLFLNAAVLLETALEPERLLKKLNDVEADLGRVRGGEKNLPRPIDLDIIFYGRRAIIRPDLEIPHPRFQERGFVLQPLADIIPWFQDPVTRATVTDLLDRWISAGGRPATGRKF